MITDSVQIQDSIVTVVNYLWDDEMEHFQESFEVEIQSQDDLLPWIHWCEQNEKATYHIFYKLMKLKLAYPDLFS